MKHAPARLGYTHFVGVLTPIEVSDFVEECRTWMGAAYGCRSGYQTPPHITLVPPFSLDGRFEDGDDIPARRLERCLADWAGDREPFSARLDGFGAFAERTLFVRVVDDPLWESWHGELCSALSAAFPGLLPRDRKRFTPHLTVANRDVPPEAFAPALEHFATLAYAAEILVDCVALFEWAGNRWAVRAEYGRD
jgi:2'-5' RNA ligase